MQGLQENKYQFYLLVLVNAFVGAMIGLERSILPGLGKHVFLIGEQTVILSFILAFGITKSIANLAVAHLSTRFTRKQILTLGWIAAIPVPFLLMYASSWWWIIAANIFLGFNQGIAWSSTVIMKIDLVGNKNRGLAMGINEFAGYLSVGIGAWLASSIAAEYGYAFFPFIPGLFFMTAGLLLTVLAVKDTTHFVQQEAVISKLKKLDQLWQQISWKHNNIGTVTINGLINNLNDAVVWGLLPILLIQRNYTVGEIGWIAATYPAVWGLGQLFTGKMGDQFCKKQLITLGMILQAFAIVVIIVSPVFTITLLSTALLGLGTALVYPNFLTVVAENLHPSQRAKGLSIFRFWRDSGYVFGALLAGVLADVVGIEITLLIIALLTLAAGLLAQFRMCCTYRLFWKSPLCIEAALY